MAKITYEDKVALNINPDIPDTNKCNASDMNEIKKVVNDNSKYILATYGASGKYYININGELQNGDIIHVRFPDMTNATVPLELSVDGGTNYYNIVRKSNSVNVLCKFLSNELVDLYFNGTKFVFKEDIKKYLYSGSTTDNFSIIETINNFYRVKVYYSVGSTNYSQEFINAGSGGSVSIFASRTGYFDNSYYGVRNSTSILTFSGTSVTKPIAYTFSYKTDKTMVFSDTLNEIVINDVVGYR